MAPSNVALAQAKRYIDHEARRRLAADYGAEVVARLGDLFNLYIVEEDDRIVTEGVRTQRIKRR